MAGDRGTATAAVAALWAAPGADASRPRLAARTNGGMIGIDDAAATATDRAALWLWVWLLVYVADS